MRDDMSICVSLLAYPNDALPISLNMDRNMLSRVYVILIPLIFCPASATAMGSGDLRFVFIFPARHYFS